MCDTGKGILFVVAVFASLAVSAEVRLANIFSSGGIVQHGKPVPVWGLADPGETLSVRLQGINGSTLSREAETVAGDDGKWIVTFDPLAAGDAFNLAVKGQDSTAAAQNMQAGDVWFYAGKYRFRYMRLIPEVTAQTWKEENPDLFPRLRLYAVAGQSGRISPCSVPQRLEDGKWLGPDAYNIFGFSPGIMNHFAIELLRNKDIPVGVVYVASLYGHHLEDYLPAAAVFHDPVLGETEDARKLAFFVGGTDACRQLNADRIAYMEAYLAESIRRNEAGERVRPPDFPDPPEWAKTQTAAIYNSAIHPIQPLAVKGVVIHDPGGPKPMDIQTHGAKLERLVETFRKVFNNSDLPVFLIQEHAHRQQNTNINTTRFAVQQMLAQRDSRVVRVVYHDLDIYSDPPDLFLKTIPAIGRRLYALAERHVYGSPSSASETPELVRHQVDQGKVTLVFSLPLKTVDELKPDGFAVKDKGQNVFRPAQAEINGSSVTLSAPGVADPEHVNYGFVNAAIRNRPNVIGVNCMPIPAFSTELMGQGKWD